MVGKENGHDANRKYRGEYELFEEVRRKEAALVENAPEIQADNGDLVSIPGTSKRHDTTTRNDSVFFLSMATSNKLVQLNSTHRTAGGQCFPQSLLYDTTAQLLLPPYYIHCQTQRRLSALG